MKSIKIKEINFKLEEETVISETNNDAYKEDFILEFARILLNRK